MAGASCTRGNLQQGGYQECSPIIIPSEVKNNWTHTHTLYTQQCWTHICFPLKINLLDQREDCGKIREIGGWSTGTGTYIPHAGSHLCWGGGIPSFSSTLSLILSTYKQNTCSLDHIASYIHILGADLA